MGEVYITAQALPQQYIILITLESKDGHLNFWELF